MPAENRGLLVVQTVLTTCVPLCRNRTGQNPVQTFKFENNQLEGPLYPLTNTGLQSVRPSSTIH